MNYVNCEHLSAKETEERIWEYTDQGYTWIYSTFGNPTFAKYDKNGKMIDSVTFLHHYVGLKFNRPHIIEVTNIETGKVELYAV